MDYVFTGRGEVSQVLLGDMAQLAEVDSAELAGLRKQAGSRPWRADLQHLGYLLHRVRLNSFFISSCSVTSAAAGIIVALAEQIG